MRIVNLLLLTLLTCSLGAAGKVEFKNSQGAIVYQVRPSGRQTVIMHQGQIALLCSSRQGSKNYSNASGEALYRVSRQAEHLVIYDAKANYLYRLSISSTKFILKQAAKKIYELNIKNSQSTLYDAAHNLVAKVIFYPNSKKHKVKDAKHRETLSYKMTSANHAGAFLEARTLPLKIRLILLNELLNG